jgi:hypothetical protein
LTQRNRNADLVIAVVSRFSLEPLGEFSKGICFYLKLLQDIKIEDIKVSVTTLDEIKATYIPFLFVNIPANYLEYAGYVTKMKL